MYYPVIWKLLRIKKSYENCCLKTSLTFLRVLWQYNTWLCRAFYLLSEKIVIVSRVMWEDILCLEDHKNFPQKAKMAGGKVVLWQNVIRLFDSFEPNMTPYFSQHFNIECQDRKQVYYLSNKTNKILLVEGILIPSSSSVMCRYVYTLNIVITLWKQPFYVRYFIAVILLHYAWYKFAESIVKPQREILDLFLDDCWWNHALQWVVQVVVFLKRNSRCSSTTTERLTSTA